MSFAKGDTFLFSGENLRTLEMHLYIVLCDPFNTPPQIVVANITTANEDTDPTVILNSGDHPFITHPSAVAYGHAAELCCEPLEAFEAQQVHLLHGQKRFVRQQQMEPQIVDTIIQGIFNSELTLKKVQKALQKQIDAANPPSIQ